MATPIAILFEASAGTMHERTTTKLCERNQLRHYSTMLTARKQYIENQATSPTERLSPRSREHATAMVNFIARKTRDDPHYFCDRIMNSLLPGIVLITVFSAAERDFFAERLDHVIIRGPYLAYAGAKMMIYDPETYELCTETVFALATSALLSADDSFYTSPTQYPLYTDSVPGQIHPAECKIYA
jgi:hypothetical protein